MLKLMFPVVKPILRHGLQIIGGALVANGVISEDQAISVVGIGVSIGTFLWMELDQMRTRRAQKASH